VSEHPLPAAPSDIVVTITMRPDGQLNVTHPDNLVLACGMMEMAKAVMLSKVTVGAQSGRSPLLLGGMMVPRFRPGG
jgi:hypothetical protein